MQVNPSEVFNGNALMGVYNNSGAPVAPLSFDYKDLFYLGALIFMTGYAIVNNSDIAMFSAIFVGLMYVNKQ